MVPEYHRSHGFLLATRDTSFGWLLVQSLLPEVDKIYGMDDDVTEHSVHGLLEGYMSLVKHNSPGRNIAGNHLGSGMRTSRQESHHSIALYPHLIVGQGHESQLSANYILTSAAALISTHPQCLWQNNSLKVCGGVRHFMDFK